MHAQQIAINEIMSSNTTSILDEDATHQDWIELYNYGTENVNLNGFGLSDDPLLPYKWRFPNVTLNANSYMIIWASDKNRIVVGQPYHTNFKLSATDGLFLTNSTYTCFPSSDFLIELFVGVFNAPLILYGGLPIIILKR